MANVENIRLKPGGQITHQVVTEGNGDMFVRENGGKILGRYDKRNNIVTEKGNFKGYGFSLFGSLIK
jgi:hypothetical protein